MKDEQETESEIEKKYLLWEDGEDFSTEAMEEIYEKIENEERMEVKQGYLSEELGKELAEELELNPDFEPVEYRLREECGEKKFTLKGEGQLNRAEMETELEGKYFEEYWPETSGSRVFKETAYIPYQGFEAEIEFYQDKDLIVVEVEVPTEEEAEELEPLGKDVTGDPSYKNKNIAD
ncbi:MAG: hypothetical protein SVV03_04520 [Candidatus Nanohaloarchaea archaeon]|nr:hypothetical protein [Candidatus Nanohaloarchaea archaeon]